MKRKPTIESVRDDLLILAKQYGWEPDTSEEAESLSAQLQALYAPKDPYNHKRLILEALLAIEDTTWMED